MPNSEVIRKALIATFAGSGSFSAAKANFELIAGLPDLKPEEVEQLVAAYNSNSQINGSWALSSGKFLLLINSASNGAYTTSQGLIELKKKKKKASAEFDDEIPF
jgi:hypothetical protein